MTRDDARKRLLDMIPVTIEQRKKQRETSYPSGPAIGYPPVADIVDAIIDSLPEDGITVEQLVDTSLATIRKTQYAVEVAA